jgi:hypothetical protein
LTAIDAQITRLQQARNTLAGSSPRKAQRPPTRVCIRRSDDKEKNPFAFGKEKDR